MLTYNTVLFPINVYIYQSGMFEYAESFNQDIGDWNVGSGTDFVSIILNSNKVNLPNEI